MRKHTGQNLRQQAERELARALAKAIVAKDDKTIVDISKVILQQVDPPKAAAEGALTPDLQRMLDVKKKAADLWAMMNTEQKERARKLNLAWAELKNEVLEDHGRPPEPLLAVDTRPVEEPRPPAEPTPHVPAAERPDVEHGDPFAGEPDLKIGEVDADGFERIA